jgi:type IX secretion system PorP/SprF family membrane protein
MKIRALYILLSIAAYHKAGAQDIHFSQFNEHHPLVNPALTGAADNLRVSAGYRSQWQALGAAFTTYGASVELRGFGRKKKVGRFGFSRTRKTSKIALGVSAYRDKSGDGSFINTQGGLSLATFIALGNKSFLSVGFQGTYVQSQVDAATFIYPNQYGSSGYDPGVPSFEKLNTSTVNYPDFAGGILWSYGHNVKGFTDDKEVKVKLGASAYHITEPRLDYTKKSVGVASMKLIAHAEMLISIGGPRSSLAPTALYMVQGSYSEIMAGVMYRFYNTSTDSKYTGYFNRTTLAFGLYYRHFDAIVPTFLVELQEQYEIGVSYDIAISQVTRATIRGGLEISLRYTPPSAFLYQKR